MIHVQGSIFQEYNFYRIIKDEKRAGTQYKCGLALIFLLHSYSIIYDLLILFKERILKHIYMYPASTMHKSFPRAIS